MRTLLLAISSLVMLVGCNQPQAGSPFTPLTSETVVETLPKQLFKFSYREGSADFSAPSVTAPDAAAVIQEVRAALLEAADSGDPRPLGIADTLLEPLLKMPEYRSDALLLRATIRQHNHEFEVALDYLDQVLKLHPDNSQAWFTKAMINLTLGRYKEAKSSCGSLLRSNSSTLLPMCLASVTSHTGNAVAAKTLIERLLLPENMLSLSERTFALTVEADIQERLGDAESAAETYESALKQSPRDVFVLTNYADLLLRNGSPNRVIELLKDRVDVDGLLIRLAAAYGQIGTHAETTKYASILRERFDASAIRGDRGHARERALYELLVVGDGKAALTFAQQNFKIQREQLDLIILAMSARATGDSAALKIVQDWKTTNNLQDTRLEKILSGVRSSDVAV